MSRKYLWQICHKKEFDNKRLAKDIVEMLRRQGITVKQAADDLDMTVWRAHNWYHKNTGMTALDLLRMIQKYDFIRQAVADSLLAEEG
ncbi:MAG: hypothetical protein LBN96_07755 [Desulfovibrio sp.]|nr:hypothetical protein [Desulfovibrio sp.]